MRSYTVVGVGAIGGYYGARLHQAGFDVRFLARSDADHLRRHGLRVDSPDGDAVLDVDVYDDPASVPPSDTVIVSVKTTAIDSVAALLPPLVVPGGSVLAMQNGLGIEPRYAAAVPGSPVLGAMCFMCCHKVGPGHVRHLDYGSVTIGEYTRDGRPAGVTAAVDGAVADLRSAGILASPVTDLATGRWQKLVWNIPFNGLSVVLDDDTAGLVSDPSSRRLAELMMHEVVVAAGACGHGFDAGFVDQMLTTTDAMTAYKPSMKLDYEAGLPLELDTIYAAPITAARVAGTAMPRAEVLLEELRRMEARRPQTAHAS